MPCPFAYLNTAGKVLAHSQLPSIHPPISPQPSKGPSVTSSSARKSAPLPPDASLSAHLRHGTAVSHREVERSAGAKALMSSIVSNSGKNGATEDLVDQIGRRDYIRWLVMLGCVYATLEHHLSPTPSTEGNHSTNTSPGTNLLLPYTRSSLPTRLARTPTIQYDIASHLYTLQYENGLSLQDLVNETVTLYLNSVDDFSHSAYEELEILMSFTPASSDLAADLRKHDSGATQSALIRILTPDQAKVTASYVKRLHALASEPSGSSSTSAIAAVHRGTLLAHAYVRYLGDLSGGQHIARRIRKRWPCVASSSTSMDFVEDSEDGFEFYDFKDDEGSVENGNYTQELKDQFRDAMDQGMEYACASSAATSGSNPGTRASLNDALVSEANVAFDLNRHLFDALVGSTLSDSIHSSSSLPTPSTAPSALGSTQMPAKDGQVRPSKAPLVACALVVLAAFYYSNGAMRSLWQMNSERLAF